MATGGTTSTQVAGRGDPPPRLGLTDDGSRTAGSTLTSVSAVAGGRGLGRGRYGGLVFGPLRTSLQGDGEPSQKPSRGAGSEVVLIPEAHSLAGEGQQSPEPIGGRIVARARDTSPSAGSLLPTSPTSRPTSLLPDSGDKASSRIMVGASPAVSRDKPSGVVRVGAACYPVAAALRATTQMKGSKESSSNSHTFQSGGKRCSPTL